MSWNLPDPDRDPHAVAVAACSGVREIDEIDERQAEALMAAFLCAAWPTLQAQNQ